MPNWKKVVISGSNAALSNLNVTNSITGSAAKLTTSINGGANSTLLSVDGSGNVAYKAISTIVAGNTNNRLVTATGDAAGPLEGEQRLTFDGSTLAVTANLAVANDAYVVEAFLAGEDALPNSDFALAHGSTSAINASMAVSSSVGEVLTGFPAGETLAPGQLVYLSSNGRWYLTDANATDKSINLLGIALSSNPVDVLIDGVVTILSSAVYNIGDIGNPLYIASSDDGANAGSVTGEVPGQGGNVVRVIGHYIKAGSGYSTITFKPDGTWIEL